MDSKYGSSHFADSDSDSIYLGVQEIETKKDDTGGIEHAGPVVR